ncbi:hypothetical protein EV179_000007 [Coemansia sp. RSA 487]|nr:hypothetical protein EV179_000007 [Coemansia sp. RSA 487]
MSAIPRPPDAGQEPGESSGNAVPIGSGSQSVGLSSHFSTPAANRAKTAAEDPEAYACDPATEKRREKIVEALKGNIDYVSFLQLMDSLGLAGRSSKFNKEAEGLFTDLAKKAPKRLEKHLKYPKEALTEMREAGVADLTGKSLETSERALTKHFEQLWEQMQCVDKTRWPGIEKKSSLKYIDFQNKAVSGSKTKPDGLFISKTNEDRSYQAAHMAMEAKWSVYESNVPLKVIGQLGDYALQIWAEQATRIFVPIFLLHGGKLWLVVSTRRGLMISPLGSVIFVDKHVELAGIENALKRLWFFATLRASEFGHVCEILDDFVGFAFSEPKNSDTTKISLAQPPTDDGIGVIRKRISRPVRIIRRSSYMYRVTFEGKDAVLKLTWVPVSRFPEGAAYQLLEEHCKGLIPEVYASGVIEHDRFGYRLEFLVVEYCGVTIDEFAQSHKSNDRKQKILERVVCDAVKRSSECIAKAYSAGVLHRDISSGNIAIKNGKAKVIDWGYAKLRDDIAIEGIDLIEEKWRFSRVEVAEEEARHDSITGTSLFMSIQVLLGASSRGLIHDMESIFYVALHSLAISNGSLDKDKSPPLGFCFVGNSMTAAARIGCLVSRTAYLKHFGVSGCLPITTAVLNSMYKFLFHENNQFIAGDFLEDADMQRSADTTLASGFMDSGLVPSAVAANSSPLIVEQMNRVQDLSLDVDKRTGEGEGSDRKATKRSRCDD